MPHPLDSVDEQQPAPPPQPASPGRRRPPAALVVRHVVDGAAPPITFVVLESLWGPRWAAVVALAVAVVIAAIRRHGGKPLVVVGLSTAFVAMHSLSAIVAGEGRAFFLPEIAINVLGLVACVGTLLVGRPVTAIACRRLGTPDDAPGAGRRHRWLTAAWAALWAAHLVPLFYLYAADSVVGLTVLGIAVNKPSVLAMAIATAVVVRRARTDDATTPTTTPATEGDPA